MKGEKKAGTWRIFRVWSSRLRIEGEVSWGWGRKRGEHYLRSLVDNSQRESYSQAKKKKKEKGGTEKELWSPVVGKMTLRTDLTKVA